MGPLIRDGMKLRDAWFLHHLSQFNALASAMADLLPLAPGDLQIRKERVFQSSLAARVVSGRDKKGIATIIYVTHGGGMPAHHFGYMYRGDDKPFPNTNFLPSQRRVAPHWFALFDF